MNFRRTKAIAKKEILHILRDPRSLGMALVMPLFMLLLFGYALTLDVDRIPTLIYDADKTPKSRELIRRFQGSRYFQILGFPEGYKDVVHGIDRNICLLSVVIPRGFARDMLSGGEEKVQLILDGSDSNTASIALGYAEVLLNTFRLDTTANAQNYRFGRDTLIPLEPQIRVWYNSEMKSKNYIVPGLIAVILMIISALITSLTIAREWEMGTMEQLLSTPVRATEIVLGKMFAFFIVGITDALMAMVAGVIIFKVPLRGNGLLVFTTSCIFLLGALCMGIMISAWAKQQLLAYQVGIISSFLPAFLLSGFIFAIDNMPRIIQIVTHIVPARYFITILKGIFLKGIGARVLWIEILFLLIYACIVFFIAIRKIKHKLV